MSLPQKVLKNIFSNWASLFVNVIISFFLAPYIVHSLGNVYYGIWVIMMQFTGYLYLLDFGIRESVIRYVARYKAKGVSERSSEIISAALVQYGFISIICLLITGIFTVLFPMIFAIAPETVNTAKILIVVTGLTIAQTFIFNIYIGILMGIQRYDVFNKVGILFMFVRLALILFFLEKGYGIIALGLIQLFVGLGANLVVWNSARKLYSFDFVLKKGSLKDHKRIWNYSIHVFINNVSQKVIFYTDALVIGIFFPPSQITFYAIAGSLIEYLRRLSRLMTQVFNPLSSEMDSLNQIDQIKELLLKGSKYTLLIGAPVCLAFIIIGKEFISLWMGAEYSGLSWPVLAVLSVTTMVSLPHFTFLNILYGMNKHGLISVYRIGEAVLNLLLSLVLIRPFGILGVAYGTAIPHVVLVLVILPIFIWKIIDIRPVNYFLAAYGTPLMASIPFAIGCFILGRFWPSTHVITLMLKLGVLYVGHIALSLILVVETSEREHLKSLFKRG